MKDNNTIKEGEQNSAEDKQITGQITENKFNLADSDADLDKKTNNILSQWSIPHYRPKGKMWETIKKHMDEDAENNESDYLVDRHQSLKEAPASKGKIIQMPRRKVWHYISAVASIVLLAMAGLYYLGNTSINSSVGKHNTQVLPDGSEAYLMPNSEIVYNRFFFFLKRALEMKGEVFYKVKKGSRFTVHTLDKQTIEVLGTQFQVISRPDFFEVFCTEGKVGVSSKDKKNYTLLQNQGVSIINNKHNVFSSSTNGNVIHQRLQGKYQYDNVTLSHVLQDFSHAYNKKVIYSGDATYFYTGYFDSNNMEHALILICEPFALTYEVNGNTVLIK